MPRTGENYTRGSQYVPLAKSIFVAKVISQLYDYQLCMYSNYSTLQVIRLNL